MLHWYYARNWWEESDAVLAKPNATPAESDRVLKTEREILAAMQAELEANLFVGGAGEVSSM
jgi:hypothetical protein